MFLKNISFIVYYSWVDKKHFAGTKMLGEISFFDGDLGTDKEFLEYEIMDLGVELLN